ncbi:TraR/DksA C4-type zinc finger protein [Candidatus Kaiserbacteria bacterium]|nr:TraR/DksA C4-type zinc finger protein [Candidatus Kaiserbacteria bacterium]
MKHLTEDQLEELRGALGAEKDSLEEELGGHGRVLGETGDWQGNSGGLSGEEADPNDAADQIEELVTNVPLVEDLEKRHHDVVDALEKIEQGMYGICEVGEEEIPLDRLEANPAARTCIAHAQ